MVLFRRVAVDDLGPLDDHVGGHKLVAFLGDWKGVSLTRSWEMGPTYSGPDRGSPKSPGRRSCTPRRRRPLGNMSVKVRPAARRDVNIPSMPSILYSPNQWNLPVSSSRVTPPAWACMISPSVSRHRAPGTIHLAEARAGSIKLSESVLEATMSGSCRSSQGSQDTSV